MYYCTVRCYKNEMQVFHVDIPWWNDKELKKQYDFKEVVCGGETDYHLVVNGPLLEQIFKNNLPREYSAKEGDFIPAFHKIDKFKEGQVYTIIKTADLYDKIIIDLWFWSSGY